jgi:methyltransferase (TIGR00027 family)
MANPASQTAVGPMTIVAVEQYTNERQRLVQDELAYHFLPTGVKFMVRLARWRPAREMLINLTEKTARGIWGSMLCRKPYIDDKIHEAIGAIDAVVILGAGLDTRPYRMAELSTLPVFEVDLPENITYKRARLQQLYGQLPAHVQLVPIDFERQNLEMVLAEYGYRADQRTFFVWEAVSQYLSEEAVRKTFDFLAKAASGSRLVFTYIRQDFMDGVNLYGAAMTYQRFRVKQIYGTLAWPQNRWPPSWKATVGGRWNKWAARNVSHGTSGPVGVRYQCQKSSALSTQRRSIAKCKKLEPLAMEPNSHNAGKRRRHQPQKSGSAPWQPLGRAPPSSARRCYATHS